MYDKDLVKKIFINVHESIAIIVRRCSKIQSANDFVVNDNGIKTLDSSLCGCSLLANHSRKLKKLTKAFLKHIML